MTLWFFDRGKKNLPRANQVLFLDARHVVATFFAFLMSVYNGGTQVSENIGARLYDSYGYTPLVLISTATTAAVWLLVPFVRIERIEAKAKRAALPPT